MLDALDSKTRLFHAVFRGIYYVPTTDLEREIQQENSIPVSWSLSRKIVNRTQNLSNGAIIGADENKLINVKFSNYI